MINMDINEKRLNDAINLKASLESKIEKLGDDPRAESFKVQLDKVNELIDYLKKENLNEQE